VSGVCRRATWWLLVAVPGLLVFGGIAGIVLPAFGYFPVLGGVAPSLDPWRALAAHPGLLSAARATLVAAFVAMPAALGLALIALAWIAPTGAVRAGMPAFITKVLGWLLSTPHAAFAIGLAFLLAPSGWLVRIVALVLPLETPPDFVMPHDRWGFGLAVGLILKELPFLFFAALTALRQVDAARLLAVGAGLGYQPDAAWFKLVLPRIYGLMRLPVYAALAYALSAVDMAIVLGPATPPTLAVLALDLTHDADLSARFPAAALALAHLMLTLAALGLWFAAERAVAALLRPVLLDGHRAPGMLARAAVRAGRVVALTAAGAGTLAILALPIWSVTIAWRFPDAWPTCCSVTGWQRALPELWRPLWDSLSIGAVVTLLALVAAIAWLELERHRAVQDRRVGRALAALPLLVSDVAFLMGVQILLLAVGFGGGWMPTALAHGLFVFPYVLLVLADPWARLDPRYERAALCLGASPWRVLLRVRVPLLLPALGFAAALGLAVSLSLYLPTIVMGGGRVATLATEAIALSSGGDRRIVGVYGTAQTALIWAGFFAAYLVARRSRGENRAA
jgi:putative thiamine transport system permease protein